MQRKGKVTYKGIKRRKGGGSLFEESVAYPVWKHPGGKLLAQGAESLTDAELFAILLGTGIKGKPAEQLASEILSKYGTLEQALTGLVSEPKGLKGIGKVKRIRLAAVRELAHRLSRDTAFVSKIASEKRREEDKKLVNLKKASAWASQYLNRNVTISNISYLLQYGKIKKYGYDGNPLINIEELKDYYDSFSKEKRWKKILGKDINWHLSFVQYSEAERTKHVHRLHPYKGKFIPQLVEYFLDSHTDEFKKEVVL